MEQTLRCQTNNDVQVDNNTLLPRVPLQKMRVLIACRGPIAQEALRVIHELGMPRPDLVISRHEWFDNLESRAPWLTERSLYDMVHRVDEYSNGKAIIEIALKRKMDAIYIGYGFLSENADFANLCETHGIRFVGPSSKSLRLLGDKENARHVCQTLGIPVVPGVEFLEKSILQYNARQRGEDGEQGAFSELKKRIELVGINVPCLAHCLDDALIEAMFYAQQQGKELFTESEMCEVVQREISKLWDQHNATPILMRPFPFHSRGYVYLWQPYTAIPIRIKATAGGGGKGQRVVNKLEEVGKALREVWSEIDGSKIARSKSIILERNLVEVRHIEVQILGDGNKVMHFGVRDCSLQTMFYQKLIEIALHEGQMESIKSKIDPGSLLYEEIQREQNLIQNLQKNALKLVGHINYRGAGTVEFLVDADSNFYFMEVNARIQVEHGVSEEISRIRGKKVSLVAEQLRIAAGESIDYDQQDIEFAGYALETRISLLDSLMLQPAPGASIECFSFAKDKGVRIEDSNIERSLRLRPCLIPPTCYDANVALNIYSGNDWDKLLDTATNNLRHAVAQGQNLKTTIPFHIGVLTWLRHNQPYVRVTTGFVSTYLCLLARIKQLFSQLIAKIEKTTNENKKDDRVCPGISKAILERIVRDPNLAVAFYLDVPETNSQEAVDLLYSLACYTGGNLWAEDEKYLTEAREFFDALEGLCQKLEISQREVEEGLIEPHNACAMRLAEIIAEVEKVNPTQALNALKKKLEQYRNVSSLAEKFYDVFREAELCALKHLPDSSRVALPKSFEKDSDRVQFLHEISKIGVTAQEQGAVVSPILGVFYISSKPDAPPLVTIGQQIKQGQTMGLVGAMKVYTEIQSPYDGVVREILVKNETLVSPGQKLIIIR